MSLSMSREVQQGHSAALKSVTVNLTPVDYKQVILSRWELPAVAKKLLVYLAMLYNDWNIYLQIVV